MTGYPENPERCALRYYNYYPDSSAGNGALMRCAPVALFCLNSLEKLVEMSRASARLTPSRTILSSGTFRRRQADEICCAH